MDIVTTRGKTPSGIGRNWNGLFRALSTEAVQFALEVEFAKRHMVEVEGEARVSEISLCEAAYEIEAKGSFRGATIRGAIGVPELSRMATVAEVIAEMGSRLADAVEPLFLATLTPETSPVVALDASDTHQEPRAKPETTQDVEDDGFTTVYPASSLSDEDVAEIMAMPLPEPLPPRLTLQIERNIRDGLREIAATTSLANAQRVANWLLTQMGAR